ncbi:hypothetical protein [Nonomuraea dietziae]|uniref:hypothetical protein n=1 Tax=Nonomuraea dietziae TaxID=65515 RepID=UPI00342D4A3B
MAVEEPAARTPAVSAKARRSSATSCALEGTSGGWIMILSALKTFLEGGKLVADQ